MSKTETKKAQDKRKDWTIIAEKVHHIASGNTKFPAALTNNKVDTEWHSESEVISCPNSSGQTNRRSHQVFSSKGESHFLNISRFFIVRKGQVQTYSEFFIMEVAKTSSELSRELNFLFTLTNAKECSVISSK
ncbi:MAG: hypothetical protein ACI9CP_001975 [Cryomorphaceae bacterium]|jgi:hypothetical protein